MTRRFAKAAMAVLALLAGPAAAQDPVGDLISRQVQPQLAPAAEQPSAEEATLVDALIVTAVRPGPAFWKVADGDSVVWVMGIPNSLPRDIEWNKSELKAHFRGANTYINAAGGLTFNLLTDPIRLIATRDRFRSDVPMNQILPPELMARLTAALRTVGDDDDGTPMEMNLKVGYAAFILGFMSDQHNGMRSNEPERSISREAPLLLGRQRVGQDRFVDVLRMVEAMPNDRAQICVEDAVRQVEAGKEQALEAARGWARGDLRVAISAERGFERCLESYPEIIAQNRQHVQDVTDAITKALERRGKSVAIVELQPLLARDGVLVKLMATPGVTVTTPDVPGLEGEIGYQPEDLEESAPTSPAV